MKKNLLKKISACLTVGMAFIVTAMMFSASTNAQIVYTDVNPDVVRSCQFSGLCGAAYSVDLNNDGINDFILAPQKKTFSCGNCNNLSAAIGQVDSAVISSTSQSWIANQVGGYALNAVIDSSLSWTNGIQVLALNSMNCMACPIPNRTYLNQSPSTGTWNNVLGKYLPLKIKVGTLSYYGWVKLSVSIAGYAVSITIMGYAYNTIANQPILAGQTCTTPGISPLSLGDGLGVRLFPNPATNHLTIDLGSNNKKVDVTITDITGKVIYITNAANSEKIEVNTEDFAAGIYVVQIQSADFIAMKKLVIEK